MEIIKHLYKTSHQIKGIWRSDAFYPPWGYGVLHCHIMTTHKHTHTHAHAHTHAHTQQTHAVQACWAFRSPPSLTQGNSLCEWVFKRRPAFAAWNPDQNFIFVGFCLNWQKQSKKQTAIVCTSSIPKARVVWMLISQKSSQTSSECI